MMSLKNPYLLAGVGAPLVLSVAAGSGTETGDNVRRATGLTALLAGGLWLWTGSGTARNVAMGTGAAWGVMKLGVL